MCRMCADVHKCREAICYFTACHNTAAPAHHVCSSCSSPHMCPAVHVTSLCMCTFQHIICRSGSRKPPAHWKSCTCAFSLACLSFILRVHAKCRFAPSAKAMQSAATCAAARDHVVASCSSMSLHVLGLTQEVKIMQYIPGGCYMYSSMLLVCYSCHLRSDI